MQVFVVLQQIRSDEPISHLRMIRICKGSNLLNLQLARQGRNDTGCRWSLSLARMKKQTYTNECNCFLKV